MEAGPDLAPGNETAGRQDTCIDDPFSTPSSLSSPSPTIPQPCAHTSYSAQPSRAGPVNGRWITRHDRYGSHATAYSTKPGSMSSTGDSAMMTPLSSMELEKASFVKEHEQKRPSRDSKHSQGSKNSRSGDPEKAMSGSPARSHRSGQQNASSAVAYLEEDERDEGQRSQEDKALKVLLFLSGPCVLLSSLNTAWACIALVITALSQPIRLCARRPTFGQQLAGLLGPTLNLQLRCIHTPLPPYANEDASYHTFMLVAVHIISPFLSFVMMFASWTLAVYWVSSKIVGDPAGQDKRDDGKETVLGLRRWWERWLMRSVREE